MLVLTRKKDDRILIGDDTEIAILALKPGSVSIGISCPKETPIMRKEIVSRTAIDVSEEVTGVMKQVAVKTIPNGVYRGEWKGKTVVFTVAGENFTLTTVYNGRIGMVPCFVSVNSGAIRITAENSNASTTNTKSQSN